MSRWIRLSERFPNQTRPPPLIRQAQQQLYQSMLHSVAHLLIAEDTGVERPSTEERPLQLETTGQRPSELRRREPADRQVTITETVLVGLPDPPRAERFNTSEHVATSAHPSTRPTRSSRNQDVDYIENCSHFGG